MLRMSKPQGGPTLSWSFYEGVATQTLGSGPEASFFLPGFCPVRHGPQPSFSSLQGVSRQLPVWGTTYSTSLLDIYLKQLGFVYADRAWTQSPALWGKHWLSHRWGLGQRMLAGQPGNGAQMHGRCQRRGPTQALPIEVRGKWAFFSSSTFSFLLKVASSKAPKTQILSQGAPRWFFGGITPIS